MRRSEKVWLRPEGLSQGQSTKWKLFDGEPRPEDVQQGELGDCWLLSAMAVLAENPELVRKVLLGGVSASGNSDQVDEAGAYRVQLCVAGIWQTLIVDDLFPCRMSNSTGNLTLAYSR